VCGAYFLPQKNPPAALKGALPSPVLFRLKLKGALPSSRFLSFAALRSKSRSGDGFFVFGGGTAEFSDSVFRLRAAFSRPADSSVCCRVKGGRLIKNAYSGDF
jgi:hypothetical protein